MASRLVNKLLHRPVSTLAMRADEPELLAATRQLFGMPVESHPVAEAPMVPPAADRALALSVAPARESAAV
jgi:hypothetical protein